MNRKLRKELKRLYPAPPPLERELFLRSLPEPELSFGEFLWKQAGYMQKGNWVLAAGLMALAAFTGMYANGTVLQVLAASGPFLALLTAAEGSRSIRFGMEELELTSRFPLKTIIASRLGILGLGNLFLLGAALPLVLAGKGGSFWNSAISLLLPYLLTAFLNLWAVRTCQERGGMYLCMGSAVLVSVLCLLSKKWGISNEKLFSDTLRNLGLIVCTILFAVLTGREYLKIIKQSEEYRWSLR